MRIGYARVSTGDQILDLQVDALKASGCEKIFSEVASGAKDDRPVLTEALSFVRPGDSFIIWKLDRMGRSLQQLIAAINSLRDREIIFVSLSENFDTGSAAGRLLYQMSGAFAEYERSLIQERVRAGLQAARARGRCGGRPRRLNKSQLGVLQGLIVAQVGIGEICETLNISRSTYYRYLNNLAKNNT